MRFTRNIGGKPQVKVYGADKKGELVSPVEEKKTTRKPAAEKKTV